MKLICFKTPLIALWMGLVVGMLSFQSCKEPDKSWIRAVFDDKSFTGELWKLEYDYWGRLTKYGKANIRYIGNSILVDTLEWIAKKEKVYSVKMAKYGRKVKYAEAYCMLEVDSVQVEAKKTTDFTWKEDTLVISSIYKGVENEKLLKSVNASYIYNKEGCITEMITLHYDAKGVETWSCHSYLEYVNPARYICNLNLMAYIVDRDKLDIFLYFLLGLDRERERLQPAPSMVRHCVNHAKDKWQSEGIYRMNDESLFHMEFISEDVKLKDRLDFTYFTEETIRTGRIVIIPRPGVEPPW